MARFRPSLTFSILASLTCLLVLTWLLFSLLAFKTAKNDLYGQKNEHARLLLSNFVNQLPDQLPSFPEGMLSLNSPGATYAARLAEDAGFERLTLLDKAGKVIFTVGKDGVDQYLPLAFNSDQAEDGRIIASGNSLVRLAVVSRNGEVVGRAGLLISLAEENRRIQRTRQLLLSYFALDFILLLGLGAFILSRIVVTPVNRLLAGTERIIGGIYGGQVTVGGSAELARLAQSFNAMSKTLEQKQQEATQHLAELELMNLELKQAREESIRSEKMASVGLLAAGTAHEIGTPLASVMGYTEILSQELENNPVQSDYLRRIHESCGQIDRILRGMLEYARPKQQTCEPVNLTQLAAQTIELLGHQGLFKGISVSMQSEPELPLVQTDPHQLQQVLINLLINANDAMAGKGCLRVSVRKTAQGAGQLLDVCDSGAGIAPEHIPRLFDPFFTTKAPGKGTGLGLAISARIIEGFGGKITVTSSPGQGSCFTLHLPLQGKGCGR